MRGPFLGKQLKLYQGDIIPDSDLEELIHGQKRKRRRKRNATREKKRLWTSRIIPYHVPQYMSMLCFLYLPSYTFLIEVGYEIHLKSGDNASFLL